VCFAGEPIVVVRTKTGQLYALEDRCAHRQVPLSQGVVDGERLRCTYHGWTYDCAGACVNVPYIGPGHARSANGVRAYPVCEVDGLLFVFPGNPILAEARKPTALGAATDKRYKTRKLNRQVAAHYSFMHENLMDMNHQFLHRRQMGQVAPRYLGRRMGESWLEVDYTFARTGGKQPLGEAAILGSRRGVSEKPRDLMTIRTEYPYQTLKIWTSGDDFVMDLWIVYVPVDAEQRVNRTFGLLSVRKPKIPGLLDLAWPVLVWFTERIFAEDREIVEMEQAAHDRQGEDWNQEVFPVIRDLRALLAANGCRMATPPAKPLAVTP